MKKKRPSTEPTFSLYSCDDCLLHPVQTGNEQNGHVWLCGPCKAAEVAARMHRPRMMTWEEALLFGDGTSVEPVGLLH